MVSYEVSAESISPMLLNILTPEVLDPANKPPRGKADEHEQANWRKKMMVVDGKVAFPSEYFEKCLFESSGQLGMKIPGKGQQTFSKYFKSAVFSEQEKIVTDVKADTVQPFIKAVSGNPTQKGSGKVLRYRPLLPAGWKSKFVVHVTSDLITDEVFQKTLVNAGKFVGLGDWRPKFGRINFSAKRITK